MDNQNMTTHRLIIGEWLTLAGIFVGCFFFLYSVITSLECRIEERMLAQEQRTDRLYEMFIDLVKESRSLKS